MIETSPAQKNKLAETIVFAIDDWPKGLDAKMDLVLNITARAMYPGSVYHTVEKPQ